MSTRVQKGNTIFRPVTKARSRTTETSDRQPTVSQDSSVTQPSRAPLPDIHNITPTPTPQAIPPTVVPVRLPFPETADVSNGVTRPSGTPVLIASSRTSLPTQATESHLSINVDVAADVVEPRPLTQEASRSPRSMLNSFSSASKKARKGRRPTTPAFDADAVPGEDLDPTAVTMSALCEDTGQGRVSSKATQIFQNHLAWKRSNREKRAKMRVMMEARKYGRNEDGDVALDNNPQEASSDQRDSTRSATPGAREGASSVPPSEDTSGNGFDYSKSISTSRYNVQVRIGPNGETIIDEESLFVDRNAEDETANYTHVEESDVTKFVNSGTYAKRFRGSRWSAEETELFYDTIWYVSSLLFWNIVDVFLGDIQTLSRMTGKDFSGPTPEIRAPECLSLADQSKDAEPKQQPNPGGNDTLLPTTEDHGEEILGDISSFDL
ncbi:hypothetical protein ID866_6911 [Astraeus odoratus]|nr:hypothetical protein ID866_6911 [Astraeus odoratus]